jgi:glutaredoxin|tara:strand:+ start:346 stop:570 length:225 start_codon:yes stop_codon:yes gene_type:complete
VKVDIITSDWCSYCGATKQLLKDNNQSYNEIDIDESLNAMVTHNLKTVPQIFMDGKLLEGGYTGLKKYYEEKNG